MHTMALLVGLALGSPADAPECRNPPSRASDSYWAYLDACGCAQLDPPARTAQDYERFLKACGQWRQRNPQIKVIVPDTPANSSTSTDRTAPECRNPPSRISDSYWTHIDACGCANLEPPSPSSQDYQRFLKACAQWRRQNPQIEVIVPNTLPSNPRESGEKTSPTPSPSAKPNN